ncbi:MAG: hypothetical protein KF778_20155 [Rhodocyclaceae bacterium]|nr:hypothetical protein [Rhodocyclaceae bacterium]
MMRVFWLLAGIAFAGMAGAAGPEKAWHAVRGSELQALFADQELGDGVHFANQFYRGGRLTGMNMGKPARGTWKVTGRELCWTWTKPSSPEECYEVRQRGHEVRMLLDGYEAFSGSLTPIEPNPSNEVKP